MHLIERSFVLLSVARSLTIILISRVLDGLLGGDVALAQAYMTGPELNILVHELTIPCRYL